MGESTWGRFIDNIDKKTPVDYDARDGSGRCEETAGFQFA